MSIENITLTSSVASAANSSLQMKKDDFVAEAFFLKSIFFVAVFFSFAYIFIRILSKKISSLTPANQLTSNPISVLSSNKLSLRTKIFYVLIDGHKAVIIETPNQTQINWLPQDTPIINETSK